MAIHPKTFWRKNNTLKNSAPAGSSANAQDQAAPGLSTQAQTGQDLSTSSQGTPAQSTPARAASGQATSGRDTSSQAASSRAARINKVPSKLDEGLDLLRERLGLQRHLRHHNPTQTTSLYRPDKCMVLPTEQYSRTLVYGPDMDGEADPGEVVWFWAPCSGKESSHLERAMVVIGHQHTHILGLLISPNQNYAADSQWIDIGSGPWDETGRPCWVRMDKIVAVPSSSIRRQGAILPQGRFERLANRLRTEYGWS